MVAAGLGPGVSEAQVKSAYLLNFAKFVKWPSQSFSGSNDPITFCSAPTSAVFGPLGNLIADKSIGGRSLVLRSVSTAKTIKGCHVLFVDAGSTALLHDPSTLSGVLAFADSAEIERANAPVVTFVLVDSRVRFKIDTRAAERAGLTISSKLLELAVEVKQ
jgi:hypothetical protein